MSLNETDETDSLVSFPLKEFPKWVRLGFFSLVENSNKSRIVKFNQQDGKKLYRNLQKPTLHMIKISFTSFINTKINSLCGKQQMWLH